jgi:hypothetical protein
MRHVCTTRARQQLSLGRMTESSIWPFVVAGASPKRSQALTCMAGGKRVIAERWRGLVVDTLLVLGLMDGEGRGRVEDEKVRVAWVSVCMCPCLLATQVVARQGLERNRILPRIPRESIQEPVHDTRRMRTESYGRWSVRVTPSLEWARHHRGSVRVLPSGPTGSQGESASRQAPHSGTKVLAAAARNRTLPSFSREGWGWGAWKSR